MPVYETIHLKRTLVCEQCMTERTFGTKDDTKYIDKKYDVRHSMDLLDYQIHQKHWKVTDGKAYCPDCQT